jgi:hypothetical protein
MKMSVFVSATAAKIILIQVHAMQLLQKVVSVQSPSQLSLSTSSVAAAAADRRQFKRMLSAAELNHSLGQWKRWQDNE